MLQRRRQCNFIALCVHGLYPLVGYVFHALYGLYCLHVVTVQLNYCIKNGFVKESEFLLYFHHYTITLMDSQNHSSGYSVCMNGLQ